MSAGLGWWAISGERLLDLLRRVEAGESSDLVYAEEYANAADHDRIRADGEEVEVLNHPPVEGMVPSQWWLDLRLQRDRYGDALGEIASAHNLLKSARIAQEALNRG